MQFRFIDGIDQVAPDQWNALADNDYPFTRHGFLQALESSGAVTAKAGWQPKHLLGFDGDQLVLALPLYSKTHSYGEYVFDWAWADAYRRMGLEYYPKLLSAIPFTPCTGPRLLLADHSRANALCSDTVATLTAELIRIGASGWHCLFTAPAVSEALIHAGTAQRIGCQFHWFNRRYAQFDDFLAALTSRKRKNIKKERQQVMAQGFSFRTLCGADITQDHWQFFFDLYRITYLKRSGHTGYLNLQFFLALGKAMPDQCVMILAEREGTVVAASLFFKDSKTLYGRYWGCIAEFDFLHFETCYYQGIDYCIAEKLERFDGGAQGEHKIARGFEPVLTYSNHWLADGRFTQAVDDFLMQEADAVKAYAENCRQHLPFSKRT